MNIVINLNPYLFQPTGVGIYAYEIFKNLAALNKVDLNLIGITSSWKYRFRAEIEGARVIDLKIPTRIFNFLMHRLKFPPVEVLTHSKVDIIHIPYHFMMPSIRGKKIITVHDIYFLEEVSQSMLGDIEIDRGIFKQSLNEADLVICDSEFTRNRLIEKYPKLDMKTTVIYPGASDVNKIMIGANEIIEYRNKFKIPENYILYVGTIEERKNLKPLIEAMKLVNDKYRGMHLIMVGKVGYKGEEILKLILNHPFIRYYGYINEEEKAFLYAGAKMVVFLSLEEGFGFPLLEAMSYGIPVIAAEGSSLKEIGGDAAFYIDARIIEEIASGICKLIEDEDVRKELVQKGFERVKKFNWKETAMNLYRTYKDLLS